MGTKQEEVNHLLERVLPWFMVDSTMSVIFPMAFVCCWLFVGKRFAARDGRDWVEEGKEGRRGKKRRKRGAQARNRRSYGCNIIIRRGLSPVPAGVAMRASTLAA